MKFVDQVRIHVKAGSGGNGAIAFRREKYVERGGPSGGDGGNGGSVIFVADRNLTTLLDFRYQRLHEARNGEHGMGSDMNGRASPDLVLRVPVGTVVKDEDAQEEIADLSEDGQRVVVAQGGRGGLGNMNFATSTRQAPRFAQDGTPGQERNLLLELKLLADVGLLGFPNAGKSTLISRVSRAKPKVADYPFTTLVPNLGLVQYRDERSFVMADIPGIIEGAAEGAGLGHQFLRHVERCKVLVHVLDLIAPGEDRDPLRDFDTLNKELEKYSPELSRKKQIVAANKMDVPEAQEKFPILVDFMQERGIKVIPISAATGEGLQTLLDAVAKELFAGVPEVQVRTEEAPGRKGERARKVAAQKAIESSATQARVDAKRLEPKSASQPAKGAAVAAKRVAAAAKKRATARVAAGDAATVVRPTPKRGAAKPTRRSAAVAKKKAAGPSTSKRGPARATRTATTKSAASNSKRTPARAKRAAAASKPTSPSKSGAASSKRSVSATRATTGKAPAKRSAGSAARGAKKSPPKSKRTRG